jgi:hypothetical protein
MDTLEKEFHRDMVGIYEKAKNECGYIATRFLQKVTEDGGLAAARQWFSSDKPQEGLFKLYDLHRLDISMEALVLLTKYKPLFTDSELARAKMRLQQLNYVVNKSSSNVVSSNSGIKEDKPKINEIA